MKSLALLFVLGASCLFRGCRCEDSVPVDSFQLTVRQIASDTDTEISILDIRTSQDATISVDGEQFHSHVHLPESRAGEPREGDVVLSAARISPGHDNAAYIQALIRPRTSGGYAGGASVYPVDSDTKLATFFSVMATNGIYKLDAPLTIVRLQDKPVTLVVGKPTK